MSKALDAATLLQRLGSLRVWRGGGKRAPHKPLLLLQALARIERGEERLMRFDEVEESLGRLLIEFGPTGAKPKPEYPFWRIDGAIWDVFWPPPFHVREGRPKEPSAGFLREHRVEAGFTKEAYELLANDAKLRSRAVALLLEQAFPSTYHEDILLEVNLDAEWETVERRVRDPAFRAKVLSAWEHRCGVCGFELTLGRMPLALDAAHIRWKQYRGPDIEGNGIALCALHHRLFDRGAFTLLAGSDAPVPEELRVVVSEQAQGEKGLADLLDLHGQPLEAPPRPELRPIGAHLVWHREQVFRRPGRKLGGAAVGE